MSLFVVVGLGLFAFALLRFGTRLGLTGFTFAVILAVATLVLRVFGILAALVGVGRVDIAFGEVEMLEHRLRQRGKGVLVVEREAKGIEIAARFLLDPAAQHIDAFCGNRRHGLAGQPFADDKRQRGRNRHLVGGLRAGDGVGAKLEIERMSRLAATPAILRDPSASTRAFSTASKAAPAIASDGRNAAWRATLWCFS